MEKEKLLAIVAHFHIEGGAADVSPLGNGLINTTYRIKNLDNNSPDYVLQRINTMVFRDVDMLQHNIEVVTNHLRRKYAESGAVDAERRTLRFISSDNGTTYWCDDENHYWRMMVFIDGVETHEQMDADSAYTTGYAFGQFEAMLTDLSEHLGETIPDFHNMELRISQLRQAVEDNKAGRLAEVKEMVDSLLHDAETMCEAEQLFRAGELPKRICHCDTKVNNILFDRQGQVLCVIDLDTVMPSFVFSDFGDFLRTAANTVAEDDPDIGKVSFRMDIFEAFTRGYLQTAGTFLTPIEISHLPYAATLFPYMQCVRFLTDYLNNDVYYAIKYPTHNLVRARNQQRLYEDACRRVPEMKALIDQMMVGS